MLTVACPCAYCTCMQRHLATIACMPRPIVATAITSFVRPRLAVMLGDWLTEFAAGPWITSRAVKVCVKNINVCMYACMYVCMYACTTRRDQERRNAPRESTRTERATLTRWTATLISRSGSFDLLGANGLKQVAATQMCGGWTQRLPSPEHGMVADNVFPEHQIPHPKHGMGSNNVFLKHPGTTPRARSGPGIVARETMEATRNSYTGTIK